MEPINNGGKYAVQPSRCSEAHTNLGLREMWENKAVSSVFELPQAETERELNMGEAPSQYKQETMGLYAGGGVTKGVCAVKKTGRLACSYSSSC